MEFGSEESLRLSLTNAQRHYVGELLAKPSLQSHNYSTLATPRLRGLLSNKGWHD